MTPDEVAIYPAVPWVAVIAWCAWALTVVSALGAWGLVYAVERWWLR